jgi:hypothetical protein
MLTKQSDLILKTFRLQPPEAARKPGNPANRQTDKRQTFTTIALCLN